MNPYTASSTVISCGLKVNAAAHEEFAMECPPTSAAISRVTPAMLGKATRIFPPGPLNMYSPIPIAIGIVLPIVNTPHGLPASAFTTTIPSPASVTSKMNSTAIIATSPAKGLISVRATSASDLPLCRAEATSTVKSCTAPASTAPVTSQISPGANPNCAASVGPTSGPAPAMAAKWWPNSTHFGVGE